MDAAKTLLPFLQRAEELQAHDKRMAFYCRMHALEQGMKLPRSAENDALLASVMKQLEVDKPSACLADDDALYVEGFAQKIFDNADAADRAGRSDDKTAKALYASSIFFDVARQFGALAPELAAKQKYAAWRAGHIRTALKQGRQPAPAGGVTDERDGIEAVGGDQMDRESASAVAGPAPPPLLGGAAPPEAAAGRPPWASQPESSRPSASARPSPPPGLRPAGLTELPPGPSSSALPLEALAEAQKAAKHAASALQFDDVETAVKCLRQALAALGHPAH